MSTLETIRKNLPAMGAAFRSIILFITVLSIPLTAAEAMDLSLPQTSSWILALYGLSGVISLIMTLVYRQPLILTGNLFIIIFITRLGTQLSYPEIIGACILAGAVVLLVSLLGLTKRLATWIPVPVVFGLLAGAVVGFVVDLFNQMAEAPVLVGGTFLVYLLSRRFLGSRIPAIFPALIAGLAIAALTGQFGQPATGVSWAIFELTLPVFSLSAILAATPVFVLLILVQANLPSIRYMQSQEYHPPERVINTVSGLGTMLGSLLGPTGISLALPPTSLVAGPEAGEHQYRPRAVYVSAGAALLVGLLAGAAALFLEIIPLSLLLALAGLALVEVLSNALERMTQGPLVLGPLFAFVIAFSDFSLLGFGSFLWALVIGTGISMLLERKKWRSLQDEREQDETDDREP